MFGFLNRMLRNPLWAIFAIALLLGVLTALLSVAVVNIKPYVYLTGIVADQAQWVMSIGWLSDLITRLDIGFKFLAATLIWAVVQSMQCLWILVGMDVVAQTTAMKESAAIKQDLKSHGADNDSLAQIPFFFTKWAKLLAIGAYAFDLVIGYHEYPIWLSFSAFMMYLKSLNPIWINGGNILSLFSMLFCFEAVLILAIVIIQWVFKRSSPIKTTKPVNP
jgi:hypothetical protein